MGGGGVVFLFPVREKKTSASSSSSPPTNSPPAGGGGGGTLGAGAEMKMLFLRAASCFHTLMLHVSTWADFVGHVLIAVCLNFCFQLHMNSNISMQKYECLCFHIFASFNISLINIICIFVFFPRCV